MAGTKLGGLKAAKTNKERHGENFYKIRGREGGLVSRGGGFTNNPKLASTAGRKGGKARLNRSFPSRIRLYELEPGSKIKLTAQRPDQDKPEYQPFTFHHVDGMYSYCTADFGPGVLNLSVSTPLVRRRGFWEIVDE